jgi:hypothetical protein
MAKKRGVAYDVKSKIESDSDSFNSEPGIHLKNLSPKEKISKINQRINKDVDFLEGPEFERDNS